MSEETVKTIKEKADALYNDNNFSQAEKLYSEAITRMSSSGYSSSEHHRRVLALVHNDRGHSRYMQVSFDEAIEDFSRAITLDPQLAVAYYNRGTIYYRLCEGKAKNEDGLTECQMAERDFIKALELDPGHAEYQLGWKECTKLSMEIQGVELQWSTISNAKLIKLLFLLDNGDKTCVLRIMSRKDNYKCAIDALEAFSKVLKTEDSDKENFTPVRQMLQRRIEDLYSYTLINSDKVECQTIQSGSTGEKWAVMKKDEDLLVFVAVCRYLNIECKFFDNKVKEVQKKLELDEKEMDGSFSIYAENIRMNKICDVLSPSLVYHLFDIVRMDKSVSKNGFGKNLNITSDRLEKTNGMKEALFFYIVRFLELQELMNRLYTYKIRNFLDKMFQKAETEASIEQIELINKLDSYPLECQPVGYCIIFSVSEMREGADQEISKIQNVFEKHLGFKVEVEKHTTREKLLTWAREFTKPKYRFYDCIAFWFLTHGDAKYLNFKDASLERTAIIEAFSRLPNFNKKPKLFFLAACRGTEPIKHTSNKKGLPSLSDGISGEDTANISGVDEKNDLEDITDVYFEMDQLIANSTLPSKFAFRDPKEGSVYVSIVCQLLEEHRGKNISLVLEKANNELHRKVFKSIEGTSETERRFEGLAKQGCKFESSLQLSFLVPSNKD